MVALGTPAADDLTAVLRAMATWQRDDLPVPLHPGDLGWHHRLGAEATAAAVRTWSDGDDLLSVGLLDGPGVLRLTIDPRLTDDEALARRMVDDVTRHDPHLLPEGDAAVEARWDGALHRLLRSEGWGEDEPWTPLRRDLTDPVDLTGVDVETVGPDRASVRAAVHRASFDGSTFTEDAWHAMADGAAYADARCVLVLHDGVPAAAATVWSAGPDRPGLLEPVGVHRDRRGRGLGTAVSVAAAAALREMGSSCAVVCTPAANVVAVSTYVSSGFDRLPDVRDLRRPA